MTMRRVSVLALVIVCLGTVAAAQEDDVPLKNWGAPPYWQPPAPVKEGGPDVQMQASAQGMNVQPQATLPSSPLPFTAITPCRLADTRGYGFTGQYGPPSIASAGSRTMTIGGQCGIPAGAVAVSFNFSAINMSAIGDLKVFPTGASVPPVATITWWSTTGLTSNAAILPLGTGGAITMTNESLSLVDIIIDVNGYYGPQSVVTSVFSRTGDVVATPGDYAAAQVTNVPAGTISATDVQGAVNQLETSKAGLSHTHGPTDITGLVSGGVVFGSPTGTLGQSPTQLVWDQTNNRLGIGTNAPTQQFELTGMMRMPMTAATTGTPTAGVLFLGTDRFLHTYGPAADAGNTFVGQSAGNFTMGGSGSEGKYNTAIGLSSLQSNSTGRNNTASGHQSLYLNTTGSHNTASGTYSLRGNSIGTYNTAIGDFSLASNLDGSFNTASGAGSLQSNTTGSGNIAVGSSAGYWLTTGSYNIDIGNLGVAGEGATIRIGDSRQTRAFIAGIWGVTPGVSNGLPVIIDSNGQLGTSASLGAVASVFGRTGAVTAQTGDYSASQVNGLTGGGVTFGGGGGAFAQDGSQFYWDASNHRLGLGTTTPGYQLDLTGMLRMPATAAATGTPTAGVLFLGSDSFLHGYSHIGIEGDNTFVGRSAGNFTMGGPNDWDGSYNTAVGQLSLSSNTTGAYNTSSGLRSLQHNTQGSNNVASGGDSLAANTTGSSNVAVGYGAGSNLTTGSFNIDIGNYGVAGEGGTVRIGTAPNQTRTFIAGIRNVTPGVSDGLAVIIDSNGQLGTSASVGAVTNVFGRTGAVVATPGDYTAAKVTNVPAGTISATEVQGALNGLDTSKAALSHTHWGQTWTGSGTGLTIGGGSVGVSASGTAFGLYASSTSGDGVYGVSDNGVGLRGFSTNSAGVSGGSTSGYGVRGNSSNQYGVYGTGLTGVYGTGSDFGVYGSGDNAGVWGTSNNYGVRGISAGYGVYGSSSTGTGVYATSVNGPAVYGYSQTYYAGYFAGPGYFGGLLTKGGGGFKIDHPLDPADKYLYHSFVESPDMKNVYDGVVTTDAEGRAVVELPAWFEALNRDFRYQLTVIGRFAQAIVEREIENNSFAIKTDKPNIKVSWQVTGIRKDPWANAHRLPVEEEKPGVERGSYLHPDVYHQPEEKSVEWATQPEMMRRMKAEREKAAAPEK